MVLKKKYKLKPRFYVILLVLICLLILVFVTKNHTKKYKIDSLRFTYQKTNGDIIGNSNYRKEYSNKDYRIHYGKCDYNSYFFEYGYLGNRIVRFTVDIKQEGRKIFLNYDLVEDYKKTDA